MPRLKCAHTANTKKGYSLFRNQKVLRRPELGKRIDAAFKAKDTVTGKVVDRNQGRGLVVDVGVRAFLPGSQFDLVRRKTWTFAWAGTSGSHYQAESATRNVVVSGGRFLKKAAAASALIEWKRLTEGQVVQSHVKNVTEYGAPFHQCSALAVQLFFQESPRRLTTTFPRRRFSLVMEPEVPAQANCPGFASDADRIANQAKTRAAPSTTSRP